MDHVAKSLYAPNDWETKKVTCPPSRWEYKQIGFDKWAKVLLMLKQIEEQSQIRTVTNVFGKKQYRGKDRQTIELLTGILGGRASAIHPA